MNVVDYGGKYNWVQFIRRRKKEKKNSWYQLTNNQCGESNKILKDDSAW